MKAWWPSDDEDERPSTSPKIRSVAKKGGKARQRQLQDFLRRQPHVFVDALNVLHHSFGSAPFTKEGVRGLPDKAHLALEDAFTLPAGKAQGGDDDDADQLSRPDPQAQETLWVAVNAIKEAVHQIIKQKNPRSQCVRHIINRTIHGVRDVQMGFEAKWHRVGPTGSASCG